MADVEPLLVDIGQELRNGVRVELNAVFKQVGQPVREILAVNLVAPVIECGGYPKKSAMSLRTDFFFLSSSSSDSSSFFPALLLMPSIIARRRSSCSALSWS